MRKYNSNSISRNNKYNGAGGGAGGGTASDIAYDNSLSGLVSQNVQQAIDELHDEIEIGNIYTTDEKKVGEWLDGSAVYERTVVYEGPLTTGENVLYTFLEDVEPIDINCFGYNSSKTACGRYTGLNNDNNIFVRYTLSNKQLSANAATDWSNPKLYVTIKYIKK